jgi:tRNA modification GTPase
MKRSTIAAIATPFGSGGIGIIKISGRESLEIMERLFRRAAQREGASPGEAALRSHRVHYGYIVDPESRQKIDEVLVLVMRSPKSYTREDVVEIHSHSGFLVLNRIFEKVLQAGARIAENGEFTKRAFLNGRIDLTQAEAVCDIIQARSDTSLQLAARQLDGRLRDRLSHVREVLNELLVRIEAAIDFPEEAMEIMDNESMISRLKDSVVAELESMTEHYRQIRFFKDGVRMAIIGRPNVGKSSLLNILVQKDRAIVTGIPGTTRDLIEESVNLDGLPVTMVDTAGVQETSEPIEKIGIEKAIACIQEADLILFLVDLQRPFDRQDHKIYQKIMHKRHIVVLNKIDVIHDQELPDLPADWQKSPFLGVSALYGTHIEKLQKLIKSVVVGKRGVMHENAVVTTARQQRLLEAGIKAVRRAVQEIKNQARAEVVALEIKESLQQIDAVSGQVYTEDILDQIFSKFCIGK